MSVTATDAILSKFDANHLPAQDELRCSDGVPMETARHRDQMVLLIQALRPFLNARPGHGYVGGNMFLYYSLQQMKKNDFVGSDVFVALDVAPEQEKSRKSWVVWEEGKAPDVVIELLSESTVLSDKTTKKAIYQNDVKVPEYFYYDPLNSSEFKGFRLQNGVYQPIAPNAQGDLYSQQLDCLLTRWYGTFEHTTTTWLRWANLDGSVLPTYTEIEQQAKLLERQRAEKLAAHLRALGINPDDLD